MHIRAQIHTTLHLHPAAHPIVVSAHVFSQPGFVHSTPRHACEINDLQRGKGTRAVSGGKMGAKANDLRPTVGGDEQSCEWG